jgi:hypothetical protein
MMNEFEVAHWLSFNEQLYMLLDNNFNSDICQHLSMTAILVKQKLNLAEEFQIFEVFLTHNYSELMEAYKVWKGVKKQEDVFDSIPSQILNEMFKKYFTNCFEISSDKAIDYNFVVDCLEDEHLKRDVHTVRHIEEVLVKTEPANTHVNPVAYQKHI